MTDKINFIIMLIIINVIMLFNKKLLNMYIITLNNTCSKSNCSKKMRSIMEPEENLHFCHTYNLQNFKNGNYVFLSQKKNYLINDKKQLWISLKEFYGENIAKTITPMSYVIPEDYKKYTKNAKNKKIIFKENIHQQKGLHITNTIQDLYYLQSNQIIVGQEFIEDCLKFNDYKLAFRLYLILKCDKFGNMKEYIYEDGLVYYGKKDIASFYASKKLYDKYPLLISDMEQKLNINIRKLLVPKIYLLINAIKSDFCLKNTTHKFYEIYGIDFHITNKLESYILEVNSGPGMNHANNYDKKIRNNILQYYKKIILNKL
jgi:hypothetical protein